MGITYTEGAVRGPDDELKKEETVRFLVDSGATYSLLPAPVLQSIGLAAKREMSFSLADGTTGAQERLRVPYSASPRRRPYACDPRGAGRRSDPGRGDFGDLGPGVQPLQPDPSSYADAPRMTHLRDRESPTRDAT